MNAFDKWKESESIIFDCPNSEAREIFIAGLKHSIFIIKILDEEMYQSNTYYNALREAMEKIQNEIENTNAKM